MVTQKIKKYNKYNISLLHKEMQGVVKWYNVLAVTREEMTVLIILCDAYKTNLCYT